MLPAKAVINKSPNAKFTKCPSSVMSRFEVVAELQRHQAFRIKRDIETKMLSPHTAYACMCSHSYLVLVQSLLSYFPRSSLLESEQKRGCLVTTNALIRVKSNRGYEKVESADTLMTTKPKVIQYMFRCTLHNRATFRGCPFQARNLQVRFYWPYPEGKEQTPMSQAGFRDSASIGA
ncbi:hypothetical protein Tco_0382618 [Tanacetum coccineum]